MTAFDQALFLLSARCRKIAEDLGVSIDEVKLSGTSVDGSAKVEQKYTFFDGKFIPIVGVRESFEPGPEVVLSNDKIFAPPALPDEAPMERVEVLPPAEPVEYVMEDLHEENPDGDVRLSPKKKK